MRWPKFLTRTLEPAPVQTRRFDGAAGGRRGFGMGAFGRITPEVAAAGATLRSRARYLAHNHGLISNGVANLTAAIVGTGITATPRHPDAETRAAIMREWQAWTEVADADQRTDFYGLQMAVARALVTDGESFAHVLHTPAGPRLRVLPAEQVDESKTIDLPGGGYVVSGIEFDSAGQRVAYWVFPGSPTAIHEGYAHSVRVPADEILHIMQPTAPGQVRGISWLASVILPASEFDQLADALLVSAKVAALHAGFISDANGTAEGDAYDESQTLEPGALVRLGFGQTVTFNSPQQLQTAPEFLKAQIRHLAAGLGVPSHWLDGDLSGANYSSLRAGLLPARARIEQTQYLTLAPQFLLPCWRYVITYCIEAGRLAAPDYETDPANYGAEWLPPAWQQVDQLKTVQADAAELAAGLTSRRKLAAARGWALEDLDAELAAEGWKRPETQPKETDDV